ncbi:hypothetical protein SD71_14075 [Cohnella kolymensis]|uniref:DUF4825 domain-containing protein n=1 Tax=Cohnella kolymensis TaxID=1590652 RepID=A0ABR5A3A0_9BACL|nr:hypothetical protein [Cohnella kolymensis]KIL35422.1 hypothetical protein SD71_14075 [Cohnella kolymensis]
MDNKPADSNEVIIKSEWKKKIIALVVVLLAVSVSTRYYSVHLSAKSVIPHSTQIERIYFSYLDGGETNFYLIEFNDKNTELHQMMSIFESVSYTRSFGSRNIRNDGKAFMMMIFYRDRDGELHDYDLDINEKSFIVSDKKKYKMVDGEKEAFERLSTWLLEKGIKQPIGTVNNDN